MCQRAGARPLAEWWRNHLQKITRASRVQAESVSRACEERDWVDGPQRVHRAFCVGRASAHPIGASGASGASGEHWRSTQGATRGSIQSHEGERSTHRASVEPRRSIGIPGRSADNLRTFSSRARVKRRETGQGVCGAMPHRSTGGWLWRTSARQA